MKGKVVRLMVDKQFGFIRGEDNRDYFMHSSGFSSSEFGNDNPFYEVTLDDEVEFEPTMSKKGLRAERIVRL